MRGLAILAAVVLGAVGIGVGVDATVGDSSTPGAWSVQSVPVPSVAYSLIASHGVLEIWGCNSTDGGAWRVDPMSLKLHRTTCAAFPPGQTIALRTVEFAGIDAIGSCHPETEGVQPVRSGTNGQTTAGPVIIRYAGSCSTTRPLLDYQGNSLWIYDSSTGARGTQGQIVRLSATSGAVELSLTMPAVPYTSFAADDDGAFVGSFDIPGPVYFVGDSRHRTRIALPSGGRVSWIYGSGDRAYADIVPSTKDCGPTACGIWRFDGSGATPYLLFQDTDAADLASTPTGDAAVGLFTTVLVSPWRTAFGPTGVEVVRIDATSGVLERVGSLPVTLPYGEPPSLAYLHHSLFVLFDNHLYRYERS